MTLGFYLYFLEKLHLMHQRCIKTSVIQEEESVISHPDSIRVICSMWHACYICKKENNREKREILKMMPECGLNLQSSVQLYVDMH